MALADLVKYVIKGTGPGTEIWQNGIWAQANGEIANASDLQLAVDAQSVGVATWWGAIKANIYALYSLTELRAYYYANGTQTADFSAVHVYTPVPGTFATVGSPIDTCCVQSLRTGRAGRAHRGRLYAPCHAPAQPTTGLWQTTLATAYANATAALLSDINSSFAQVVIASRATGDHEPVTQVTVDQKPDVQRRRENRLGGGTLSLAAVTAHV